MICFALPAILLTLPFFCWFLRSCPATMTGQNLFAVPPHRRRGRRVHRSQGNVGSAVAPLGVPVEGRTAAIVHDVEHGNLAAPKGEGLPVHARAAQDDVAVRAGVHCAFTLRSLCSLGRKRVVMFTVHPPYRGER